MKIILQNMEFHARHGVLAHEKAFGNTFIVHLEIETDEMKGAVSDRLEDTLNYQEVYDLIASEMQKPTNLLEHAVSNTARLLLKSFDSIRWLKLSISKLHPPLGGKVGCVTVETILTR